MLNARFQDAQGLSHTPLLDTPRHKATVFLFVQPECPIANQFAPTIERLWNQFEKRNVQFYLIYADKGLTPAQVRKHTGDYQLTCPALLDPGQVLVRHTGAEVTPEAAVLDSRGKQVYRGRIDDRFVDWGRKRPRPTSHDLQLALESLLAGKTISPSQTKAIGCYLPGTSRSSK